MSNFDIKKSSRKCFESGREFQPGEEFFSALVEGENGAAERRDFSQQDWDGPPESCIGWWKSRVPEQGKGRVFWVPKQVLLAYFQHVQASPDQADIAFVTALLLVQKKVLILEDLDDESKMFLRDKQGKQSFEVAVTEINPQRLAEIQEEFSEKLFMDQPDDGDPDDGDSDLDDSPESD